MYLFGYVCWTFKIQNILGIDSKFYFYPIPTAEPIHRLKFYFYSIPTAEPIHRLAGFCFVPKMSFLSLRKQFNFPILRKFEMEFP